MQQIMARLGNLVKFHPTWVFVIFKRFFAHQNLIVVKWGLEAFLALRDQTLEFFISYNLYPFLQFIYYLLLVLSWSQGSTILLPPPSGGGGEEFSLGKIQEKKGNRGEKRERKRVRKKKKHNYITVLTDHESGEGNSNDTSFLLFLNSDNITFPSCLEEKSTSFPRKCNKVSPITNGEEKSDILEKFHIFLHSLILLLV